MATLNAWRTCLLSKGAEVTSIDRLTNDEAGIWVTITELVPSSFLASLASIGNTMCTCPAASPETLVLSAGVARKVS